MKTKHVLYGSVTAAGLALLLSASQASITPARRPAARFAIDNDDIGGVVTGPTGPEAGVWVIAETTDLPTKFVKIVVTDDRGRYLVPGSAEGQLQRVGARLRAGRLAEGADDARQDAEPDGGRRRPTRARRPSTTRPATGSR